MHKKKLILGYTLIELLVVIGMVGVLTTGLIVLINPAHQLKKGRDAQRKGDLKTYQQALELYRADNNTYPSYSGAASNMPINTGGITYLRTRPVAPAGGACNYVYVGSGSTYTMYSILENLSDPDAGSSFSVSAGGCSGSYNYSVLSP